MKLELPFPLRVQRVRLAIVIVLSALGAAGITTIDAANSKVRTLLASGISVQVKSEGAASSDNKNIRRDGNDLLYASPSCGGPTDISCFLRFSGTPSAPLVHGLCFLCLFLLVAAILGLLDQLFFGTRAPFVGKRFSMTIAVDPDQTCRITKQYVGVRPSKTRLRVPLILKYYLPTDDGRKVLIRNLTVSQPGTLKPRFFSTPIYFGAIEADNVTKPIDLTLKYEVTGNFCFDASELRARWTDARTESSDEDYFDVVIRGAWEEVEISFEWPDNHFLLKGTPRAYERLIDGSEVEVDRKTWAPERWNLKTGAITGERTFIFKWNLHDRKASFPPTAIPNEEPDRNGALG